ncbi:MAG: bifunctional glycosyltransferase family 2/GtrA family protein, partial [Bacteroidetes bacterium]|nr:bifunctional glycosyltransferase family 2/GtrA family protein [Bacteroidota bacterium]
GYGAALISGFKNASKEWTFFSDADGQFDLSELEHFIPATKNFNVIIGYRKKRNDPFMRLMNAKGWNLLNRIFFGLKVIDIDCAFKLFKTNVIQSVIEHVNSHGAMISAEFLIRLQRKGYQFEQIPVGHFPRTAGSPTGAKPSVILKAFKEMAYVYRGDLGPNWIQNTNRFILTGILNTITDIVLYVLLSRLISIFFAHLTWAKGVSYAISLVQNYLVNFIVFSKEKPSSMLPTLRFLLLGIASLSINTSVMFIAYNNLQLGELVSVGLATIITFFWEFSISKVFTLH